MIGPRYFSFRENIPSSIPTNRLKLFQGRSQISMDVSEGRSGDDFGCVKRGRKVQRRSKSRYKKQKVLL